MSAGAGAALTAADHAGDDDPIAAAEATHVATRLYDLTHELVTERESGRNRKRTVIQVQVRAADRGPLDAHDRAA